MFGRNIFRPLKLVPAPDGPLDPQSGNKPQVDAWCRTWNDDVPKGLSQLQSEELVPQVGRVRAIRRNILVRVAVSLRIRRIAGTGDPAGVDLGWIGCDQGIDEHQVAGERRRFQRVPVVENALRWYAARPPRPHYDQPGSRQTCNDLVVEGARFRSQPADRIVESTGNNHHVRVPADHIALNALAKIHAPERARVEVASASHPGTPNFPSHELAQPLGVTGQSFRI